MLRPVKHVILVGNNTADLAILADRLIKRCPELVCSMADIRSIGTLCSEQLPDMIFVYVTGDTARFPYVRAIRQQQAADEVPVLVGRAPLTAGALEELLESAGWPPVE